MLWTQLSKPTKMKKNSKGWNKPDRGPGDRDLGACNFRLHPLPSLVHLDRSPRCVITPVALRTALVILETYIRFCGFGFVESYLGGGRRVVIFYTVLASANRALPDEKLLASNALKTIISKTRFASGG
jgi:hypothetical protein